jgi:hypothetical protein
MADIGDVDDMSNGITLIRKSTAQRVGEHVSAQVADMLVAVYGRPAAVYPRSPGLDRQERLQ